LDLLAARLGALRVKGLLALVFLTHRLARLLDMISQLVVTPCGGCVGCVRVLGPCIRAMLSLALLTGPLALLLELMTRLGITAVGLSYRVPLPAFLVHLPANEYINAALHDAVIDLTYFAISDRLLFLSLLLLALCGVGRPPRSHVHMYTAEQRRRVEEEAEQLLSDAGLSQSSGTHQSLSPPGGQSEAFNGERKRLLHLAIPHSASRPLDRPSLNRLRASRPVSTLDYFNSQMVSMLSSPSHGHAYAYKATQLEAAMAERSRQLAGGESPWAERGGHEVAAAMAHVKVLSVHWLVEWVQSRNGPLPPCQHLPPESTARLDELVRWSFHGTLPIVLLSYRWLHDFEPDRHAEQLTALLPVLRAFADKASQVPDAERGPIGTRRERYEGDVGIVIDWAALPQRSERLGLVLSAADEERMPESVRRMNALYAMAHTFVIMLSGIETQGTGYRVQGTGYRLSGIETDDCRPKVAITGVAHLSLAESHRGGHSSGGPREANEASSSSSVGMGGQGQQGAAQEPGNVRSSYHHRGWPFFECHMSALAKQPICWLRLDGSILTRIASTDGDITLEKCLHVCMEAAATANSTSITPAGAGASSLVLPTMGRPPPLSPPRFRQLLHAGLASDSLAFSKRDDAQLVPTLYAQAFSKEFSSIEHLSCASLGWGSIEVAHLAQSIEADPPLHLTHLHLGGNPIGDEGLRAIAAVVPHLRSLRSLRLEGHCAAEPSTGAQMVRDACRRLGSHVLVVLEPPGDDDLLSGQLVDASGHAALLVYKLLAWPAGRSSLPTGFADAVVRLGTSATEVLLVRNDYVDMASLVATSVQAAGGWTGNTVHWQLFAHEEFERRLDDERRRRFNEGCSTVEA